MLMSPSVSPILVHIFVSVFNKLKYLTMLATVSPPKTEISDKDENEVKFYILPIVILITSASRITSKKVLIYSYKPAKTAKVFGNSLDILPSVYHHKSSQPLNLARIHPFSPYSEVSKSLAYDVTSKISQG